jgi:hypothetical protein
MDLEMGMTVNREVSHTRLGHLSPLSLIRKLSDKKTAEK